MCKAQKYCMDAKKRLHFHEKCGIIYDRMKYEERLDTLRPFFYAQRKDAPFLGCGVTA